VHAQKELAFEEQNPSSSLGKTTTRTTPETITAEDDDDSAQKDAHGSEGGGEWQFATPASKGLSQSSLEVCSFFLSLSLFLYLIRESRGSHVEVGEHLSSSSSSLLPLSLSRLIIFWRSSRLSFSILVLNDDSPLFTFLLLRVVIHHILRIHRRQTRVSRSSLGETAS
jgi:hypothetical protein